MRQLEMVSLKIRLEYMPFRDGNGCEYDSSDINNVAIAEFLTSKEIPSKETSATGLNIFSE